MTQIDSIDYSIPELAAELERGPKWLRDRRKLSRDAFNRTPVPPRGLHLWRYTDPSRFLFDRRSVNDSTFDRDHDSIQHLELKHLREGHLAAFATDFAGREVHIQASDKLAAQGVIVSTLSEAVEKNRALVELYLYQLINQQTGKFEAMNGALWNDGIFIYVPNNTVVEQPIHLLRESGQAHSAQFPRLLVVAGRNAEVTVVDEYAGGSARTEDGITYSNGAVEIFGLQDSRVRYVSVQRQALGVQSYLTHRARIERGASILTIPLAFGASVSKQNFGVIMNGPFAESKMFGLLFGTDHQQFDNHTLHHHAHGHTHSNIDFKVVLGDKATSAYTGLIRIDRSAQVCEAYQENRNLLLNPGTKAESIPELEILNEEVMCTHGATVGPVDPMELFYLNSRGIAKREAVQMAVSGFIASTLKLVPEDLRERITEIVERRLEVI